MTTQQAHVKPDHPRLAQKQAVLESLKKALDTKRQELEKKFDDSLAQRRASADLYHQPATDLSPEQMTLRRRQYVDSDPMVQEWSKSLVAMERELETQKALVKDNHPLTRQQAALDNLRKKLQAKRQELEKEFDDRLTQRMAGRTGNNPESHQEATITATFTTADVRDALAEIARQAGVPIAPDATVKPTPITAELAQASPEAALQQVLKGTPYLFKKQDGRYLVFRPLSETFANALLPVVLWELSNLAELPIIVDPNVSGDVTASLDNASLDEALGIVLAGKPYVFKKTPQCYVVADRSRPGFLQSVQTRRIRLNNMPPARAKQFLAPVFARYVQVEPANPRDPNNQGTTLLVTACPTMIDQIVEDIRQIDHIKRQVLLEARVVSLEKGNLQKLVAEWTWLSLAPRTLTSQGLPDSTGSAAAARPYGLQIGYAPDRKSTNTFTTALNLLVMNNQADIVDKGTGVALDGRQAEMGVLLPPVPAVRGEGSQMVQFREPLWITPHLGDNNDITLHLSVVDYDHKNIVTIKDGGTFAVVGLAAIHNRVEIRGTSLLTSTPAQRETPENPSNGGPGRDVAVFVTAHIVPDTFQAPPSAPPLPTAPVQGPPMVTTTFANTNLREILAEIARRSGVTIRTDATVKPEAVNLDMSTLVGKPVLTALRMIAQSTQDPYLVRPVPGDDRTFDFFKPICNTFFRSPLDVALVDLSTLAEVPIIVEPNVSGTVTAPLNNVSLDEALRIMLAGTPYAFARMPGYYVVSDANTIRHPLPTARQTRRVRLDYVGVSQVQKLLSPTFAPHVHVGPSDLGNPNHPRPTLLVTAPFRVILDRIVEDIWQIDHATRRVLLEARVATITRGDLRSRVSRWDRSAPQASLASGSTPDAYVEIGYTADQARADWFLAQAVSLQDNQPAAGTPGTRVLAQEAREVRITGLKLGPALSQNQGPGNLFATIAVTPHFRDGNDVILHMDIEVCERESRLPSAVVRRASLDTLPVEDGGTVILVGMAGNRATPVGIPVPPDSPLVGRLLTNRDNSASVREVVVFLTVHRVPAPSQAARSVPAPAETPALETCRIRVNYVQPARVQELLSPVFASCVQVEPPNLGDPNNKGNVLLITAAPAVADRIVADIKQIDRPEQWVLLDTRVVAMEKGNLLKLGAQWSWPTTQGGVAGGAAPRAWPYGLQIGYLPDQAGTDGLRTELSLLLKNDGAKILAQPTMMVRDGERAKIAMVNGQWHLASAPCPDDGPYLVTRLEKVEPDIVMTITPYIGDNNDIMVRMAVQVTDSIPKARGSDLPLVTRRMAKNSVTIKNGGTAIVAGLTESGALPKDGSSREVAILVTVRRLESPPVP